MKKGLSPQQIQKFHDDGFLIVRDLLPSAAYQPLLDELVVKVDELTNEAVSEGLLDPADTFSDAPFTERLALVSNASSDQDRIWGYFDARQGKRHKTAGMFNLKTHPSILDAAESLIGPEIYSHPQYNLRAKLPGQDATVVPWHQDLAYLKPEDAGETLFRQLLDPPGQGHRRQRLFAGDAWHPSQWSVSAQLPQRILSRYRGE